MLTNPIFFISFLVLKCLGQELEKADICPENFECSLWDYNRGNCSFNLPPELNIPIKLTLNITRGIFQDNVTGIWKEVFSVIDLSDKIIREVESGRVNIKLQSNNVIYSVKTEHRAFVADRFKFQVEINNKSCIDTEFFPKMLMTFDVPIKNFIAESVTEDSVILTWNLKNVLKELLQICDKKENELCFIFEVDLISSCHDAKSVKNKIQMSDKDTFTYRIDFESLNFSNYTASIRFRSNTTGSTWSEKLLTSFVTKPGKPRELVTFGAYNGSYNLTLNNDGTENLYIFFIPLSKCAQNGANVQYRFYIDGVIENAPKYIKDANMVIYRNIKYIKQHLTFKVQSFNRFGESGNSSLIINLESRGIGAIKKFETEYNSQLRQYTCNLELVKNTYPEYAELYWCSTLTNRENECSGPMNSTELDLKKINKCLPGNSSILSVCVIMAYNSVNPRTYYFELSSFINDLISLKFAYAGTSKIKFFRSTTNIFSGLLWSDCPQVSDVADIELYNFKALEITTTTMTFEWNYNCKYSDVIKEFSLKCTTDDGIFKSVTFGKSLLEYKVFDLIPNTNYTFEVYVNDIKILENYRQETKKGRPDPPINLRHDNTTADSTCISFKAPINKNCLLNGFRIYHEIEGNDYKESVKETYVDDSNHIYNVTIINLERFTKYFIKVETCCEDYTYCSISLAEILVLTDYKTPDDIEGIETINDGATIEYTWSKVERKFETPEDIYIFDYYLININNKLNFSTQDPFFRCNERCQEIIDPYKTANFGFSTVRLIFSKCNEKIIDCKNGRALENMDNRDFEERLESFKKAVNVYSYYGNIEWVVRQPTLYRTEEANSKATLAVIVAFMLCFIFLFWQFSDYIISKLELYPELPEEFAEIQNRNNRTGLLGWIDNIFKIYF